MNLKSSKIYRLSWLINCLSVPFLLVSLPSNAATFTTFSHRSIELRDFSPLPQGVAIISDGQSRTIAEVGIVQSTISVDANFTVDNVSAIAHSNSRIATLGIATDFLADINFFSTLIGRFSIAAGDSLRFNFNGSLALRNLIDDLSLSGLSTSETISLFLQDITNQKTLDILEIIGVLNTNLEEELKADFFSFNTSENVRLDNRFDVFSFEETEESLQTFFSGSFLRQFNQDTELALVMVTQSCNYASNDIDVCVRVPEPRNNLAILIGVFGLGCVSLFLRIMKKIVKLTS